MLTLCSPMLALEMLSPIAVTETAEVGTGWERGGEGVTTGLRRGEDDQVGGWGGTPLSGSAVLRRRPSHLWL